MKCIICGSKRIKKMHLISEVSRYTKKSYPLYKCKDCGFIRPYPLPYSDNTKSKIYDNPDNIRFFDKKSGKIETWKYDYKDYFKHFQIYLKLIEKYKIQGKALDVGCGAGHLLELMSNKGLKSEGLEVSKKIINALKGRFKIYDGDLKSPLLIKEKYDLITFNQVLEHVEFPEDFIKDVNKILKKEGYVIFSVPYVYGLLPNLLRSKWYGLGHGQHLNFFSKKSINLFLNKGGFEIEEIILSIFDYTHLSFPSVVNFINNLLMKIIVNLKMGDNMFVVAKKIR